MKTIQFFTLILAVVSLGLAYALVAFQDPLTRQSRMLRARLTLAKEYPKPSFYLTDCGHLLDRAEAHLQRSRALQSTIRGHTGGPAPRLSPEQVKDCEQMQLEITRLRATAQQLLNEAAFVLNLQPATL